MMRSLLIVTAVFFMFVVPASAQSTFTLDQVFVKLDEASKTFKSIEANVEQTHVTVVVDDKEVKTGKLYYMRQGKEPRFKLEISKPQPEFVLVDKGKGQVYTPRIKQVQEFSTS